MKIPSHIVFATLVILGICALGVGLTFPLWMVYLGYSPREAMDGGTGVTIMSMGGLVIIIVLGGALQALRKSGRRPR